MAATSRLLFSPLPDGESRVRSFGAGLGLEFIALALLVVIPMLMPQRLEVVSKYWITPISAPPVVPWKPQPRPTPKPEPVKQPVIAKEVPPAPVTPPKPKIYSPVFTSPIARPATAKRDTPKPDEPDVTPVYADKTPVSLGSSAIPTLKKPREAVQTGGFGDPNGVPANPNSHGSPNINTVGSYDLPPGPGYGNGTGGAKGARGVVASSGFGNGVATSGKGGGSRGGGVQQGVFADESPAAAAPKMKPAASTTPHNEPVEILFKPRPQYTDIARQKKIEGDVLLQVVFTSTGQVQVEKVIRGLGYGLDETAQAAAHQIQFKPARQDGQPVDFAGIVHITFELAY